MKGASVVPGFRRTVVKGTYVVSGFSRTVVLAVLVLPVLVAAAQNTATGPFTVAMNTATIEGAPVYVAEARTGGFRLITGGVRDLTRPDVHAATNAETQMLLASVANPKIRMLFTLSDGLYRVIARKSAGIRSIADLRGKKITTVPQTSAHYSLVKLLATAGVKESEITYVNAERTEMARAVLKRDADAISMWEPEARNAVTGLGDDAIVFQDSALYRERFIVYTTTDVLSNPQRRRELVSWVREILRTTDTVRRNPEDAFPIVARTVKQSEDTVRAVWKEHAFPAALPADMLDLLVEEEGWVAGLQQRAPRSRQALAAFIEPSVLKEAAAR